MAHPHVNPAVEWRGLLLFVLVGLLTQQCDKIPYLSPLSPSSYNYELGSNHPFEARPKGDSRGIQDAESMQRARPDMLCGGT